VEHDASTTPRVASLMHRTAKYCDISAESQHRQPYLGNVSANTPVTRQRFSGRRTVAATEELLEAVFYVRSVPRLYNEAESRERERESLETVVRRVGVLCETAARLRGYEPGSGGASAVGRRYQATQ
jgi:hypothetical protein